MIQIRMAEEADAMDLLNIYKPYIETPITFECEVPSIETFSQRIREITADYPYLVCETDGKIVGYAYAHRHKERAAYRWNAELSIYIDEQDAGRGIGKMLYHALIHILVLQNVKNVYGGVTMPNPKSEGLHKFFGFQAVGIYHNTGYKCGKWHDVIWFEKQIGEYDSMPYDFLSIPKIDRQKIADICENSKQFIR